MPVPTESRLDSIADDKGRSDQNVLRSTIFSEDHGSCISSTFNAVFSISAREPRDTVISV